MPVETFVGNDAAYGSNYGPLAGGLGALPVASSQSLGTAPSLAAFQAKPPSVAGPGTLPTVGPSMTGGLDKGAMDAMFGDLLPAMKISDKDIQAAVTPVAQRAPAQMPAAFGYRTPNPPPPQMLSGAVGAGAARGQGISNAVSATVGALAQFKATRDQRKQEADATKVSRLVEAQNAITQAQQIQPGQPGYDVAQQTIKQNQTLVEGMFQDPKFVKTVEKGFQISLTDPSQNKTPDHNIVQRGLDMFRKQSGQQLSPQQMQQMGQQAAQRFQASQPQTLAPNAQAQAILEQKLGQQKVAQQLFKDRMDYVKAQMETEGKLDVAQINAFAKLQGDLINRDTEFAKIDRQFSNEQSLINYRRDADIFKEQAIQTMKSGDPSKIMELYNKANDDYTKGFDTLQGKRTDLMKEIEKEQYNKATGYEQRIMELRQQIDKNDQALDALKNHWETNKQYVSTVLHLPTDAFKEPPRPKVGEGVAGGAPDATGAGTSQQSPPEQRIPNPFTGDVEHRVGPAVTNYLDQFFWNQLYGGGDRAAQIPGQTPK